MHRHIPAAGRERGLALLITHAAPPYMQSGRSLDMVHRQLQGGFPPQIKTCGTKPRPPGISGLDVAHAAIASRVASENQLLALKSATFSSPKVTGRWGGLALKLDGDAMSESRVLGSPGLLHSIKDVSIFELLPNFSRCQATRTPV